MDELWLVGRILFGLLFIAAGARHLADFDGSVKYAESKNVPAPPAGVVASGLAFLVGGFSVILGVWGDLGALILIVTLIPLTFLVHQFWRETDAQARENEMLHFMKDIAILGGAVLLFSLFARDTFGAGLPYTITDGLFNLSP
jgi:uncharacterized membrane protein YphA (DoxX/SURF4 family)